MKTKMKYLSLFLLFMVILIGCTKRPPEKPNPSHISRVDVQTAHADGNYSDEIMITDIDSLKSIEKAFEKITWNTKVQAEMARREDVKATMFYRWDKNQPELLFEYRIWFSVNDSATIISNNVNENYGHLEKDSAKTLRKIVTKYLSSSK